MYPKAGDYNRTSHGINELLVGLVEPSKWVTANDTQSRKSQGNKPTNRLMLLSLPSQRTLIQKPIKTLYLTLQ